MEVEAQLGEEGFSGAREAKDIVILLPKSAEQLHEAVGEGRVNAWEPEDDSLQVSGCHSQLLLQCMGAPLLNALADSAACRSAFQRADHARTDTRIEAPSNCANRRCHIEGEPAHRVVGICLAKRLILAACQLEKLAKALSGATLPKSDFSSAICCLQSQGGTICILLPTNQSLLYSFPKGRASVVGP